MRYHNRMMILIKQMHQKSVIFATIGIFLNKGFKFQPYVVVFLYKLI